MKKFIINLVFFAFIVVCYQTISYAQAENSKNFCKNLSQIKTLPRHNEKIDDKAYNDLIKKGEKAIPCLIEKITDVNRMNDPRCPKFTDNFTVGDMAYSVLYRIGKFDFVEMLPPSVQELYKTEGVFAYHWFVEQEGNRNVLQNKLQEWYSQKEKQTNK